jgi:hypothetical protein
MAEYIVNAQNQKLLAMKEAELKAEKKFQERLEKLFAASGVALPGSVETVDAPFVEPTLFELRNARVVAAAKEGKSRWGEKEVERAAEQSKNAPVVAASGTSVTTSSSEPTLYEQRNARIIAAASEGKSRWGEKEISRALEQSKGSPSTSQSAAGASLYDQRNAKVVAAAAAGKGRWGDMEVERVKNGVAALNVPSKPSPTVASLEDRVNLGARLVGV